MTANLDKPAMPGQVKYHGGGAVEVLSIGGLTAREHACIQLRVPKSGDDELDSLIRESLRAEFAAQALAKLIALGGSARTEYGQAIHAVKFADALLSALEAPGGAG